MIDSDLAELYEVPTKFLNQAVRRNARRFPEDFMFQLTAEEADSLRSQIVTSKKYDEKFKVVFTALRKLIAAPEKPRREIGFKTNTLANCGVVPLIEFHETLSRM